VELRGPGVSVDLWRGLGKACMNAAKVEKHVIISGRCLSDSALIEKPIQNFRGIFRGI
jgi:hypothetical protein